MSREDMLQLLRNSKATGSFVAFIDGEEFLRSEQFLFYNAGKEFFIIGSNNNEDRVEFSVPTSLQGDGPHIVQHPSGRLEWDVMNDNVRYPVESGSVTVTFDNNRSVVSGAVDFIVKHNGVARKVTGKFDIRQ